MHVNDVCACTNTGDVHDEEPMRTLMGVDNAPKFDPTMVMRVPGV